MTFEGNPCRSKRDSWISWRFRATQTGLSTGLAIRIRRLKFGPLSCPRWSTMEATMVLVDFSADAESYRCQWLNSMPGLLQGGGGS